MALTVRLRDHDPHVTLVGKDGESSVVLDAGRYMLHGKFALSMPAKSTSDWVLFNENSADQWCEVAQDSGWVASRMTEIRFTFPGELRYQPGGSGIGPWLRFSIAKVLVRQQASILSLPNVSMSLLPSGVGGGDLECVFPSSAGTQIVQLKGVVRPGVRGILLEKDDQGLKVLSGGINAAVLLNNFRGVSFQIATDCPIVFRTGAGRDDPPMAFDGSLSRFGMRIVVDSGSGARLNDSNPYSPTATEIRVDKIEAGGNWFTATECRPRSDKDVFVAAIAPFSPEGETVFRAGIPGLANANKPTSELRFHFPIDLVGGAGDVDLVPHFEYRGLPAGTPPNAAERREVYRGLRIRGLGWSKTGPARLDASVGRIALLRQQDGSSRFAFEAGKPLKIRGAITDSVVAPKLDRLTNQRVLTVPCGQMAVEIRAANELSGPTSIVLDTNAGTLQFTDPKLVGPPLGVQSFKETRPLGLDASGPSEGLAYDRWQMGLTSGQPNFVVRLTNDGAFPDVSNQPGNHQSWQEVFQTETTQPFPQLEHPGVSVLIDPPRALSRLAGPSKRTTITRSKKWDASGKEKLVYSSVAALISYKSIRLIVDSDETFLPDDAIIDASEKMDDPSSNKWVVANGIDDQVRVYYWEDDSHDQDAEINRFILDNIELKPNTSHAYWPFAKGLSILLYKQLTPGQPGGQMAPEIARLRGKAGPGLAFDWSHFQTLWERANGSSVSSAFGWDARKLKDMKDAAPALWPRLSGRNGSRLDPTDKRWRGILMRDLPMVLNITPHEKAALAEIPFLKNLIDKINDHLVLDYGWKDETGSTWSASVLFSGDAGRVSPPEWDPYITLNVIRFGTIGAAGKSLAAKGELKVTLPPLKDDNGNAIELTGTFSFDLENGAQLGPVEVSSTSEYTNNSFPGFDKFTITRFSTDFRYVQIDAELKPSNELAAALPVLNADVPLLATIRFDLTGSPSADVTFLMPAEQNTNLFGKWPLVLQGLRMSLKDPVTITASCRLNLGLGSFTSVGGDIIVTKGDDGFDLNVSLHEIGGSVNFGDFSLAGAIYWSGTPAGTDPPKPGKAVKRSELANEGRARDIWGLIQVSSGNGLFGDFGTDKEEKDTLWLRIGSRGELTYWIAALNSTRSIPFGPGRITDGMFILAKNADKDKLLETSLANMAFDAFSKLRLKPSETANNWLASWKPSDKAGTLVAASGYLEFNDVIASSSQNDDEPDSDDDSAPPKKYLTSLAFTSNGIVRVEATIKLLGVENVRVGIGVDFPRHFFSAGIQLPKIGYPPPQNPEDKPEFEIQGGQIVLGAGFKPGKRELYLNIGWPPRNQGDSLDPLGVDWSKSVMIRWDNFFPINTFWGGMLAAYKEADSQIKLGFALRAGWTKQWKLGGDLIGVSAELGVAVGGAVIFVFAWNRATARPVLILPEPANYLIRLGTYERRWQQEAVALSVAGYREEYSSLRDSQRRVREILSDLEAQKAQIDATVFIDVWGNASAKVLGVDVASIEISGRVRLHLCLSATESDLHISRAEAYLGFVFKVKVGCYEQDAHGEVTFTFIANGECASRNAYGHLAPPSRRLLSLMP